LTVTHNHLCNRECKSLGGIHALYLSRLFLLVEPFEWVERVFIQVLIFPSNVQIRRIFLNRNSNILSLPIRLYVTPQITKILNLHRWKRMKKTPCIESFHTTWHYQLWALTTVTPNTEFSEDDF
jgi:hypothetical protein